MHIIGHHIIRERLGKFVRGNKISQGYLFSGPQSVGKSLCALEFASVLVDEPDFEPSEAKPHPFDVLIIRPEEVTKHGVTKAKSIGAEAMREALQFLGRFPAEGRFRVVIIEDAHKLTQTAQNSILKSLEEPKSTAVIILVTHEGGAILSTVLSRVERVRFDYVPSEEIRRDILPVKSGERALAPFFFSLGRPGIILRAERDPQSFEEERGKLERLFRLSALTLGERLGLAEELAKNVSETLRLLEWWLPGLHTQALKGTDTRHTTRFFWLLEAVEETLALLKATQSNARLLLEKLFLSV
ncbi:MAG: AAA family ATPase [Candidatus Moranbacteria bacterium]|nr:AAA family ATPase [Candidatus Moranbacteria bacterium]